MAEDGRGGPGHGEKGQSEIMALIPYALTRPFLFGLDPERAHELTLESIATLQNTPLQCCGSRPRVADPVTVAGLKFPNRIGLAAGLDKNGRCIDGLGAMGFGFIEVGTVTPKGQPGNDKPRMFRLPEAKDALINRLGFNNEGLAERSLPTCSAPTASASRRWHPGPEHRQERRDADRERGATITLLGLEGVFPHADYITVNISSPNTKNLRALQSDEALDALLSRLQERKPATGKRKMRPQSADVRQDRT